MEQNIEAVLSQLSTLQVYAVGIGIGVVLFMITRRLFEKLM